MLFTLGKLKDGFRFAINPRHLIALLLLTAFASVTSAQQILNAGCEVGPVATYPATSDIDTYPMTSDRYAVQYKLGGERGWTDAHVYISKYGETEASPYRSDLGYTVGETSMSFASIPAGSNTSVELRVHLAIGFPCPWHYPFSEER